MPSEAKSGNDFLEMLTEKRQKMKASIVLLLQQLESFSALPPPPSEMSLESFVQDIQKCTDRLSKELDKFTNEEVFKAKAINKINLETYLSNARHDLRNY